MQELPAAWREAFRREAEGAVPKLADPLPERRLARLLGAFIATGLVFLVLPGTLLGVWNLVSISSRRQAESIPAPWIQAHGHAQLFGWVATFIIGISLYTFPKFRGANLRSLSAGWLMWAMWTAALAARWASAVWGWQWNLLWPLSAAVELAVALMLVWQCSASGRARRGRELWNTLVFAGFGGLIAALAYQLVLVWPPLAQPMISARSNHILLGVALWGFSFPAAWGYSVRFLPSFLGLAAPEKRLAYAGLGLLAASFAWLPLLPAAVLGAALSLRIFEPARKPAKLAGVDPRYPWFVRSAYGWVLLSSVLALWPESKGLTGASRHAFTVGFLAVLIFSIGPRILPSFLNSRELWSSRLMLAALLLLSAGCALRVASEPPAYAGLVPFAWRLLPVSAVIELTAVLLFAFNIGATLLSRMPAWIEPHTVHENLPLYWYVTAYPGTRKLLVRAGLKTLAKVRRPPRGLTLREAAEAAGIDWRPIVDELRTWFAARLARALRRGKSGAGPQATPARALRER